MTSRIALSPPHQPEPHQSGPAVVQSTVTLQPEMMGRETEGQRSEVKAGVNMNDTYSLNNIDSLLFHLVCRANIAERRTHIKTVHGTIETLEEDIGGKQSTVTRNKENAKSTRATNNLLLQYEQSLKAELESRKANYNQDMEVYEERIASYRKTFQSHKEYYFQNPVAQRLLTLHAEKEEIERRIKACDDQIAVKQRKLDRLAGPAVTSISAEKLPDRYLSVNVTYNKRIIPHSFKQKIFFWTEFIFVSSVFGQQALAEPETQSDHQTEEDSDSSIDISSLHLSTTENGHKTSVEENAEEIDEENMAMDLPTCCTSPEKQSQELGSFQQSDEQSEPVEMYAEEQDQQQQQSTVAGAEEALEDEMQERAAADEEPAPSDEYNAGPAVLPQASSVETNPQSFPAKIPAVPSTPTFPFSFSPAGSPRHGTSDPKSPAFLLSLNSGPSTPAFSGFGFDVDSPHEEDSAFAFTGSFFNEKKTSESKSSGCTEFLFDQSGESADFQFAFSSDGPQSANTKNTKEDFSFSFNF
ncbi:protein SIX6OS1 [Brachyistius frenatus]|uniref:protein SIX6OS1 n=1 Tax=Brachyistius frenatus TaxID=100188 RepID=UPI0037E79590